MSGMRIRELSIARAGRTLLSGLSCDLDAGTTSVVLGPNGAGKSSLLLALAGLIPASGDIDINDRPLASYRREELTCRIAWQGELPPTEFGLTVRQRLLLAEREGDIGVAADAMDVAALLDRPLGELSSGERQRVELAALMLREAPLWLLDEPTAHLDMKHQIRCLRMLDRQRAAGRAIVVVLHDIQQAMAVADRLILIDGRGGVEYGAAESLFDGDRLSHLFDAPLLQRGGVLMPDYMGDA